METAQNVTETLRVNRSQHINQLIARDMRKAAVVRVVKPVADAKHDQPYPESVEYSIVVKVRDETHHGARIGLEVVRVNCAHPCAEHRRDGAFLTNRVDVVLAGIQKHTFEQGAFGLHRSRVLLHGFGGDCVCNSRFPNNRGFPNL